MHDAVRLMRHSQVRGKPVKGGNFGILQFVVRNEHIHLGRQQNFILNAQLRRQILGDLIQILRLAQRSPIEILQFRIHRLGIIVAQKSQTRFDLLFRHQTTHLTEAGIHLDEHWQKPLPLARARQVLELLPDAATRGVEICPVIRFGRGGFRFEFRQGLIGHVQRNVEEIPHHATPQKGLM